MSETFRFFCSFFRCFGCRFYAMFCVIYVDFRCHFEVILNLFWGHFESFWCPWGSLGHPGVPRRFGSDSGPILGSLWEPLGHPSGSLFGPFGRPEGPRSEKNGASESVCSQARFFIGFSSLSGWTPKIKDSVWEWYTKQEFRPRPNKIRF